MGMEIRSWNTGVSKCQTWAQIMRKSLPSCFLSRVDALAELILLKLYEELFDYLLPRIKRLLLSKLNAAVRECAHSLTVGEQRQTPSRLRGSPWASCSSGSQSVTRGPWGSPIPAREIHEVKTIFMH